MIWDTPQEPPCNCSAGMWTCGDSGKRCSGTVLISNRSYKINMQEKQIPISLRVQSTGSTHPATLKHPGTLLPCVPACTSVKWVSWAHPFLYCFEIHPPERLILSWLPFGSVLAQRKKKQNWCHDPFFCKTHLYFPGDHSWRIYWVNLHFLFVQQSYLPPFVSLMHERCCGPNRMNYKNVLVSFSTGRN